MFTGGEVKEEEKEDGKEEEKGESTGGEEGEKKGGGEIEREGEGEDGMIEGEPSPSTPSSVTKAFPCSSSSLIRCTTFY